MNLKKLNGWQRIWAVIAGLWLIPTTWIVSQSFPTESQVRSNAQQVFLEAQENRRQKDEEINNHCRNISEGDVLAYAKCWQINNGTPELNTDEAKAANERKNSHFWKENMEAAEYNLNTGLAELPKQQVQAILKGILLWALPLMAIYLLGYSAAWIRSGFKNFKSDSRYSGQDPD